MVLAPSHPVTVGPARGTGRRSRSGDVDLVAVAHGLADVAVAWPGSTDPPRRQWQLLTASADLEAWVIAWPVGGAIELHDHGGSDGAVLVVAGELVETALSATSPGPATGPAGEDGPEGLRVTTLRAGSSIRFDGHHVHDVLNAGRRPAVSVHVYRPRLTTMTYYRLAGGVLRAGRTERFQPGSVVP